MSVFGAPFILMPEAVALNPLRVGLVGLWNLGDTLASVSDLSGNGKTGTIADNGAGNISLTTLGGRPAISANGGATAARYTLGSITSADPLSLVGATAATVVFRMAGTGSAFTDNGGRRVIDKSNGGNAAAGWGVWCSFNVSENRRALAVAVNEVSIAVITPPPIDIAATAQTYGVSFFPTGASATHRFYKAGSLYQSVSGTLPVASSTTTNAAIANWNHSTDRMFQGVLDFVGVWDRELSAAEHAEIAADPGALFA